MSAVFMIEKRRQFFTRWKHLSVSELLDRQRLVRVKKTKKSQKVDLAQICWFGLRQRVYEDYFEIEFGATSITHSLRFTTSIYQSCFIQTTHDECSPIDAALVWLDTLWLFSNIHVMAYILDQVIKNPTYRWVYRHQSRDEHLDDVVLWLSVLQSVDYSPLVLEIVGSILISIDEYHLDF